MLHEALWCYCCAFAKGKGIDLFRKGNFPIELPIPAAASAEAWTAKCHFAKCQLQRQSANDRDVPFLAGSDSSCCPQRCGQLGLDRVPGNLLLPSV